MSLTELLILGAVIGSNNLAVALSLGALGQKQRIWRIVVIFGLFEFSVPLAGIWLGRKAVQWLTDVAHWLSPALLIGLGIWIGLVALFRNCRDQKFSARNITHWGGLLLLAAGLSLDNLIVGFSLGLRDVSALQIATVIAAFSMVFTWAGVQLGHESRRHWETPTELVAGLLLIALGLASGLGWF